MSYYDNILNGADAELGKDWNADATREEAFKVWNVQFNAKPKENVTVGHTWTKQAEWKNDASVESVKTASKFGLKAHGINTTAGFANDKFSLSAGGQLLKEQDWTINATGSYETKPAKKEWKATAASTVASPDFSGVKAFVNLNAEHNEKKEWTLNGKINLNIQKDHNIGVSTEHDTKNFTKIFAQATTKDGDQTYWFRSDILNKTFNVGCKQNYKNWSHSYNAEYGQNVDFKGVHGTPVVFTAGGKYTLSEATNFTYNAKAGQFWNANVNFNHKIDAHWKVGAHQHFDGARLNTKRNPYDLGFNIEYNL